MTDPPASEITALLAAASQGDKTAFDQLFPLLYQQLKRWPTSDSVAKRWAIP